MNWRNSPPLPDGDVLIFMPGKYEITRTLSAVRASRVSDRFVALPLYGELPPAEQDAALARYDKRKAIIATNVAETSLTIEGVRVVIDSGLARIARFDPRRGINTLLVEKISRASADQRAGRAGRTAPGRCLRLWTEREHSERAAQELAGSETPRPRRSRAHAEGERHRRHRQTFAGSSRRSRERWRARSSCSAISARFGAKTRSLRSGGGCWRSRSIRVTRGCCWRRRNIVACARSR